MLEHKCFRDACRYERGLSQKGLCRSDPEQETDSGKCIRQSIQASTLFPALPSLSALGVATSILHHKLITTREIGTSSTGLRALSPNGQQCHDHSGQLGWICCFSEEEGRKADKVGSENLKFCARIDTWYSDIYLVYFLKI